MVSSTTVSLSPKVLGLLEMVCSRTGQPIQAVIESVLEDYARREFFRRNDLGYAELQADPVAWAEHLAEREAWLALPDGLNDDEIWTEDGTCVLRGEDEKGTIPCEVKSGSPILGLVSDASNKAGVPS